MGVDVPSRSNGQTIDETWFNGIREDMLENQDIVDFMRANTSIPFLVNGLLVSTLSGVMYWRTTQAITLLSANLVQITPGSSGSLQVDLLRKSGVGAFTSIFNTKPQIPYTAGTLADSNTGTGATAAVLNSLQTALSIGDFLRFDLTAVQPDAAGCLLTLNFKPTGT